MERVILGIDISKLKFDVCLKKSTKGKGIFRKFDNNIKGFEDLSLWLNKNGAEKVHAIMEATGRYGEDLSYYLYGNNHEISVVNPLQIKAYGQSLNSRTKTDKKDASLIAEFGLRHELRVWTPTSKDHLKLRDLMRCLWGLKADGARLKNRLESCREPDIQQIYKSLLGELERKLEEISEKVDSLRSDDEGLDEALSLLETIPGIGSQTAASIIGELPDIGKFKNTRQVVAYAGLNPSIRRSGTSVNTTRGISKKGSRLLRTILYYPTMNAIRFNPVIKRYANGLQARGKNGKAIIIACMRKLLELAFGMLKRQEPFRA